MALAEAAKESVWLRRLLTELESWVATLTIPDITSNHLSQLTDQWKPMDTTENHCKGDSEVPLISSMAQIIYTDNQGAIKLSGNPQFHSQTKHIEIRYHFIRKA